MNRDERQNRMKVLLFNIECSETIIKNKTNELDNEKGLLKVFKSELDRLKTAEEQDTSPYLRKSNDEVSERVGGIKIK